jgi:hypothetical protein
MVGQSNTFEGKKNSIWSCRKKVMLPDGFFNFWAGQAVKTILAPKFGGLA